MSSAKKAGGKKRSHKGSQKQQWRRIRRDSDEEEAQDAIQLDERLGSQPSFTIDPRPGQPPIRGAQDVFNARAESHFQAAAPVSAPPAETVAKHKQIPRAPDSDDDCPPARRQRFLKPLRHDVILSQRSAVPATVARLQAAVDPKKDSHTVKQINAMAEKIKQNGVPKKHISTFRTARPIYDVWTESHDNVKDISLLVTHKRRQALEKKLEADPQTATFLEDFVAEQKKNVKRPKTAVAKVPSKLKAVETPLEGSSYNPSFEAHQAALKLAVDEEMSRIKRVEPSEKFLASLTATDTVDYKERAKQEAAEVIQFMKDQQSNTPVAPEELDNEKLVKPAKKAAVKAQEIKRLQAQVALEKQRTAIAEKHKQRQEAKLMQKKPTTVGLQPFGEQADDDEDDEGSDAEEEDVEVPAKASHEIIDNDGRKTTTQRNKERLQALQEAQLREKKDTLKREKDLHKLTALKRKLDEEEAEHEAAVKARRDEAASRVGYDTLRLSKHRFEDEPVAVKLAEDLTGSLRTLRPEGNPFNTRYKSMQKRNIVEPRVRVKGTKAKLKSFQRKTFKEYDRVEAEKEAEKAKLKEKQAKKVAK